MKIDVEKRCVEAGVSFEDIFEGIIIGPKSRQDIFSLKSYIEERKTSFGFSNKDTYYRFYFLEVYKEFGKPFIQKPNLQSFNYYSIK